MKNSSKKLQGSNKESNNDELFLYEKKSQDGKKEIIEELEVEEKQDQITDMIEEQNEEIESAPPKKSTIKILEEKDIQYKEAPPPNFSPYFRSYLHFKNKRYNDHKKLTRKEFEY